MLIPVPGSGSGAVVVGESVLTYISATTVRSCAIKPTLVKASKQASAMMAASWLLLAPARHRRKRSVLPALAKNKSTELGAADP